MYASDSIIPGSGIVFLDLVLETDLALVADIDERPEQGGKVEHAAADLDLAVLVGLHGKILDVHVVQAIPELAARLDGIRAGAGRVADVDAKAEVAGRAI